MKTGICSSIGRQPPSGLTPASRYRRIVSWPILCWSPRYFCLMASMRGCRAWSSFIDLKLLCVSRKNSTLVSAEMMMITQP